MARTITFETKLDTQTQMLHNLIIWHDGTIRPMYGHNQCTGEWGYDGQVFYHNTLDRVGCNG